MECCMDSFEQAIAEHWPLAPSIERRLYFDVTFEKNSIVDRFEFSEHRIDSFPFTLRW